MGSCCSHSTIIASEQHEVKASQDEIIASFVQAGQAHVFQSFTNLGKLEQENLLRECQQFDVHLMNELYSKLVANFKPDMSANNANSETAFDTVEPEKIVDRAKLSLYEQSIYKTAGNKLIREGKVGTVILAGGQGSRLGFNGPKGKYNIGLPSQKSLFQILTERFMRAQLNAHDINIDENKQPDVPIQAQTCTMFVMTSYENHDETVNFFRDNNYFGAHQDSFVFFPQMMLPALDASGKILMSSSSSLKLAPNGNGALFDSLKSNREVQGLIATLEYI